MYAEYAWPTIPSGGFAVRAIVNAGGGVVSLCPVPQPPTIVVNTITRAKAGRNVAHFAKLLRPRGNDNDNDNEEGWSRQRIMAVPFGGLDAAFANTGSDEARAHAAVDKLTNGQRLPACKSTSQDGNVAHYPSNEISICFIRMTITKPFGNNDAGS